MLVCVFSFLYMLYMFFLSLPGKSGIAANWLEIKIESLCGGTWWLETLRVFLVKRTTEMVNCLLSEWCPIIKNLFL